MKDGFFRKSSNGFVLAGFDFVTVFSHFFLGACSWSKIRLELRVSTRPSLREVKIERL
jgi:hypothetical protein